MVAHFISSSLKKSTSVGIRKDITFLKKTKVNYIQQILGEWEPAKSFKLTSLARLNAVCYMKFFFHATLFKFLFAFWLAQNLVLPIKEHFHPT